MKLKLPEPDKSTVEQAQRMLIGITGIAVVVALGFAAKPYLDEARVKAASATLHTATRSDYQPAEQSIAAFRDERTRNRSVTAAQLNAIIDDTDTDDATRREAQQSLIKSMERSEQETAIEGLITALGFEGCVASVGADSCTVIVKAQSLSRQQAARILDVACRETGMLSGSIKVIPVE